ncbi:MAG TPA: c-type cytochrome [Vicinamibacterales bacterium]|nr:c-type cytochrome [Vicinamibacterales bacterium]
MRFSRIVFATSIGFASAALVTGVNAQRGTPPPSAPATVPSPGRGPNFPQQQRALADPAVIARGRGLFGVSCASCHGHDLRGGDQGGPNLLRSSVTLTDQHGELILPIVHGARAANGMPPVPLPDADVIAIAEYIHSVLAEAGRQGRPPEADAPDPDILVGDAAAGRAYFDAHCTACHSASGDLKGLATRVADPRALQNLWVSGGGGRGRGAAAAGPPITVTVTPASGTRVEGRLVRIDDFVVTLIDGTGARRTFTRHGSDPAVAVHDPLAEHRQMVARYTDADMHNVTAYLVSLE